MDQVIFSAVAEEIAAALQIPVETIHPDSRMEADLGAESIDLIDLAFRLEKRFHLTASNQAFFRPSDTTEWISSQEPHRALKVKDIVVNVQRLLENPGSSS